MPRSSNQSSLLSKYAKYFGLFNSFFICFLYSCLVTPPSGEYSNVAKRVFQDTKTMKRGVEPINHVNHVCHQ